MHSLVSWRSGEGPPAAPRRPPFPLHLLGGLWPPPSTLHSVPSPRGDCPAPRGFSLPAGPPKSPLQGSPGRPDIQGLKPCYQHTDTDTHRDTHTYMCTHTLRHTHTCAHTRTHTHICTHIHVHTHMHTVQSTDPIHSFETITSHNIKVNRSSYSAISFLQMYESSPSFTEQKHLEKFFPK